MTLALEIEYLSGVVFAAQGPDTGLPDWPPQPDRIFSALTAAWGARGEQDTEADALRWLEKQPIPLILASETEPRTAPVSFVPPNDPKTGRSGDSTVLPAFRRRQPRRFPASRPHDPIVRFYWKEATPDENTIEALSRIAADTAYVGHSASLTRCRFFRCSAPPAAELKPPKRRIYEGRFAELRRDYARFVKSGGKVGRPQAGDDVTPVPEPVVEVAKSSFSPDWLVLEHTEGEMPDIRAAALLSKEIRDAILSGYRQCGMGDRIPSLVSGHTEEGRPVQAPHLAIVPLAFAGHPYADGHVLGFALVPPRGADLLTDVDFLRVMRTIAPLAPGQERRELRLHHFGLGLSPTLTPSRRSLDSAGYTKRKSIFATVTPIVLDRHLKKDGAERQNEIVAQIKTACLNIGLPDPEVAVPDKHSAIEGAPSAQPSGKSPAWMRWRLPASLASRPLTHAVIQFPCPVAGPVILGAGRFVGLGLCRPIAGVENMA